MSIYPKATRLAIFPKEIILKTDEGQYIKKFISFITHRGQILDINEIFSTRIRIFKTQFRDPRGSLRPFQGVGKKTTIFIIILKCYLPFLLFQHLHRCTKVIVDKTAGSLARITVMTPKCASSHCIIHHHTQSVVF